jgi:hypothetical protein
MKKYEEKEIDGKSYIELVDVDKRIYSIPKDPANSDYQRYLRWLNGEEEGGQL